jgi:hypothetical protein
MSCLITWQRHTALHGSEFSSVNEVLKPVFSCWVLGAPPMQKFGDFVLAVARLWVAALIFGGCRCSCCLFGVNGVQRSAKPTLII